MNTGALSLVLAVRLPRPQLDRIAHDAPRAAQSLLGDTLPDRREADRVEALTRRALLGL